MAAVSEGFKTTPKLLPGDRPAILVVYIAFAAEGGWSLSAEGAGGPWVPFWSTQADDMHRRSSNRQSGTSLPAVEKSSQQARKFILLSSTQIQPSEYSQFNSLCGAVYFDVDFGDFDCDQFMQYVQWVAAIQATQHRRLT
ncbi:hypothetical protein [Aureimonas glaciei]|uniref:hypothetical protein n=1 Tax=Aureimonas glaciei TaxID=1776957 RepID=UPI00166B5CD8|nr:hypothetical protein [Aureimonas glaciei]